MIIPVWLMKLVHKIGLTQSTKEIKPVSKETSAHTWWQNGRLGNFKIDIGNEGHRSMPNEVFETEEQAIQYGLDKESWFGKDNTYRIYVHKYVECDECSHKEWKLQKVVTVREVNKLV